MASFKELATKVTSSNKSPLMEGRVKISTDSLSTSNPNGITITAFDILEGKDGKFGVFTYAENDGAFFFGASILNEIACAWAEEHSGDIEGANAALKAEGGVKVKLTQAVSRQNRRYTAIEVL